MNGVRGEVELVIDGVSYTLCLTLGALAKIETQLGCQSIKELEVRMGRLSAVDLKRVLGALIEGPVKEEALEKADPAQAAQAVAHAFNLALEGR